MEPMETEPTRRVQSGCSVWRIVNLLLAFHFLLIMITALVVVGVMGALDLLLSKKLDANGNNQSCPIFVQYSVGNLQCGNNSICYFVEAAYGLIAFLCLVYFVIQVIRGVFQFNLWFTAIVDMVAVLFSIVLCFATAITVSVGLSITCSNIGKSGKDSCDILLPDGDPNGDRFYPYVNAAQGAAWVCMLFLVIMFVVTIMRVVVFVKRRKAGTPIDMDGTLITDDFDDKPEDS